MTRKKRGCLLALAAAALLLAAGVIAVMMLLPGDLQLGGSWRAAPDATTATPPPPPAEGVWMTYVIPNDILEAEVRKAFPIPLNVVDLVRLQLDKPTFVTDQDGSYLRLRLVVEARVLDGGQSIPGIATVRTRLGYDRSGRRVMLRNTQLVDLTFTGSAASAAGALQPVLAQALATEMEGYVIFEVPADGLWWLKTGVGFVRDVYVKDGRVALGLGP